MPPPYTETVPSPLAAERRNSSRDGDDFKLTERELAIARRAAKIAIQEMTDDFYKQVGKTVFHRILIYVGLIVAGILYGKGWLGVGKLF